MKSDMVPVKFDQQKPKLGLIDPAFLRDLAAVLMMGEAKYGTANWMPGLDYSRIIDAAKRHLSDIELGIDVDADSNKYHAIHVAANMMFLSYYMRKNRHDLDDRRFKEVQGVPSDTGAFIIPHEPNNEVRLHMPTMCGQGEEQPTPDQADPIRTLQSRIKTWADKVIPHRTCGGALAKLLHEEIPELANHYDDHGKVDPLELADAFILIIDIAHLIGVDIVAVTHQKMAINETREWGINPLGLVAHTKKSHLE